MILTFELFGAASKTLTLCNLSSEGSLLADTGKIRQITAIRRRTIAFWDTFLLLGNISLVTSLDYQQLVMEKWRRTAHGGQLVISVGSPAVLVASNGAALSASMKST